MSGIVGFINNQKNKKEITQKMIEKIIYRGTKHQSFYDDNQVGLGQCLLKNKENVTYQDNLAIVLDGNIFNKEELIKKLKLKKVTDAELILASYKKWGSEAPKYLKGDFAFVIWDKEKEILYGARDYFGIKPLFYSKKNDFIFASEIKAILAYPNLKKELNKDAIAPYLVFNFNPLEETFFKDVFTLKPGHYFIYQNGEFETKKYFEIQYEEVNYEKEKFVKLLADATAKSVQTSLKGEKKVGSFLSSGVDSSYLVCLAKPKKTFTVGYAEQRYSEITNAKELSEQLGIENKSRIINKDEFLEIVPKVMYHLEEPMADPGAVAFYFGTEAASQYCDVVTCGEGADEFFAGYGVYQDSFKFPAYAKIPFFMRRAVSKLVSKLPEFKGSEFLIRRGQKLEEWYTGLNWIFREKELKRYLNNQKIAPISLITKDAFDEFKGQNDLNKMLGFDVKFHLSKNFMVNVDRLSAAFSLDTRVPIANIDIFDIARKIPFEGKVSKTESKIYWRAAAQTIIPNESFKKKKLGFPVPLREWIKEENYYNHIKEMFSSDIAKEIFNYEALMKMLNDKNADYKKVWSLYSFLVWYHEFFKQN